MVSEGEVLAGVTGAPTDFLWALIFLWALDTCSGFGGRVPDEEVVDVQVQVSAGRGRASSGRGARGDLSPRGRS